MSNAKERFKMKKSVTEILLDNLPTFTPEVKSAIQSLLVQFDDLQKNFSIAVKIIDELIANKNPRVEIIDETHRCFNGEVFKRNKFNGYYEIRKTLHNAVYQFYNNLSEIPKGYVVHHNGKNCEGGFDKEKNDIEHLILMKRGEHIKLHNPLLAQTRKKKFICKICGKIFEASNNGKNCYCSRKCKLKAHRKYAQTYREERICKWCGKKFLADKHRSKGYCSIRCGNLAQWDRFRKNKN